MKRILNTLLLAVLFTMVGQTQNASEYAFTNGVKGIAFDSIRVHRIMPNADGARVFLIMRRKGSVQKVMGSVMSGGKDIIWLAALGVVDFSNDMKVTNEEVTFLKPDGIVFKNFNLLDGQGRNVMDFKVIGTQDDCVKSNYDLYEKYPQLKEKEEKADVVRPAMYYDNYVNYSMLGGKLKSFETQKFTLKDEDKVMEKSLFQQLVSSEAKYDKDDSSKDMEGYRGSVKKDFWMRLDESTCDPKTGVVYAHHGHMINGEKGNRGNLFWQETVTFDKDGNEMERTEMDFKKPHDLVLRKVFTNKTPDNLYNVEGIVHVYTQLFGFGYKKLNPEPNKKAAKYYEWDATGKLVGSVDFELPAEGVKIQQAFKNGNGVTLLARSIKPASYFTIHFMDGKLIETKPQEGKGEIAKGIGFSPSEIGGLTWKFHSSYNQPDGAKMVVYLMDKVVTADGVKTTVSKGYSIFRLDKTGKLTHTQNIKRSDKGDPKYKINLKLYPSDDGKYVAVFRDPQLGGSQSVSVLEINGADLSINKVHNLDNALELNSEIVQKTNSAYFFLKTVKKTGMKW